MFLFCNTFYGNNNTFKKSVIVTVHQKWTKVDKSGQKWTKKTEKVDF